MLIDQYQAAIPLKALLADFVAPELLNACNDLEIGGLAIDSRKVKNNDLFFACQGEFSHGLMFADTAVKNGAVTVIWDECENCDAVISEVSQQVSCLRCDELKMKMGKIADRFYQHPSAQLRVTGVTGTNGKTSIAHFIAQCMDEVDKRCGVLGTLGNGFLSELSTTGFIANEPQGMFEALKWGLPFKLPIIVTENGIEDEDDSVRPSYLVQHLHQIWRAVNFNWPVKGYFHWSLVDNFEWERGWTQRFGLWELDVETQARRRRPSADLYAAICRENGISSDIVQKYAPRAFEQLFPVG